MNLPGKIVASLLLTGGVAFADGKPGLPATNVSPDSQLSSRAALSGGMGVEYLSAPDVVDYVNGLSASFGATTRIPEFKAGVAFFGAFDLPLSEDWVLKAEDVYLLTSYNTNVSYGSWESSLTIQMPTLIVQYVLWDERLYNLKAGAGLGYHFATLHTQYDDALDEKMSGNGPGAVLELEANTAFGDHLFAYLGGDVRFEFIGRMKRTSSVSRASRLPLPTVNAFSIGARLGMSYYF